MFLWENSKWCSSHSYIWVDFHIRMRDGGGVTAQWGQFKVGSLSWKTCHFIDCRDIFQLCLSRQNQFFLMRHQSCGYETKCFKKYKIISQLSPVFFVLKQNWTLTSALSLYIQPIQNKMWFAETYNTNIYPGDVLSDPKVFHSWLKVQLKSKTEKFLSEKVKVLKADFIVNAWTWADSAKQNRKYTILDVSHSADFPFLCQSCVESAEWKHF